MNERVGIKLNRRIILKYQVTVTYDIVGEIHYLFYIRAYRGQFIYSPPLFNHFLLKSHMQREATGLP